MKWRGFGENEEALKRVAADEGVSIQAVLKSVTQIQAYHEKNTSYEMDLAVRDFVISTVPRAKETLDGLLTATELVEQKDPKTGKIKVIKVEDKTTRLEAERLFKDIVIGLQPKQPMIQQNISQTNQTANISGESNEERFRRLRKAAEQHNLLPPEVAAVPAYIDADEDSDDGADEDDEETDEDE
jgi:hypothetical protein